MNKSGVGSKSMERNQKTPERATALFTIGSSPANVVNALGREIVSGAFPENTVNQLVEHQLITYAELRRGFAGQEPEADAR